MFDLSFSLDKQAIVRLKRAPILPVKDRLDPGVQHEPGNGRVPITMANAKVILHITGEKQVIANGPIRDRLPEATNNKIPEEKRPAALPTLIHEAVGINLCQYETIRSEGIHYWFVVLFY
jgi:hypothetical protein